MTPGGCAVQAIPCKLGTLCGWSLGPAKPKCLLSGALQKRSASPCAGREQMFYGSVRECCVFWEMQPNRPCVCLERQRCALWIRKLCEPSGTGTGIQGRKNRNLYAKLLLHMLQRGVLEGPFTQRPEPGTLRALPSYMVGVCVSSALLPMPRRGRWRPCLPTW